ncbi:glycosyltransferase family 2 protein [Roseobacter sp. HKCCD5988]|uniref:glycosyltransferase family 2 protein n=1 Tax=Roseobacter sp. HKCCD5988 TaxID=3120338 RepID=UPI0030EF0E2C
MSEKPPVFSVIVPTFKSGEFIEETVASVIRQTYSDWELIVSDDGSDDTTLSYLENLSDPRVRILHGPRKGAVSNFNFLIQSARGKYIKPLGHDDYLFPLCLEEHHKVWLRYPNVSLVSSFERAFGYSEIYRGYDYFGFDGIIDPEKAHEKFFKQGNWIGGPQAVSFKNTGTYFNEKFKCSFDFEMWMRMSQGKNLFLINKVLYGSRIHKNQLSNRCIRGGFQNENFSALQKFSSLSKSKKIPMWAKVRNTLPFYWWLSAIKDRAVLCKKIYRMCSVFIKYISCEFLTTGKIIFKNIKIDDKKQKICFYRGTVDIDNVLVRILDDGGAKLLSTFETPHYQWALSVINGTISSNGEKQYFDYILNNFVIKDLDDYRYKKSIMMRELSECAPCDLFIISTMNKVDESYFVVFDGAHRLAMLAAKGVKKVDVWSVVNLFDGN